MRGAGTDLVYKGTSDSQAPQPGSVNYKNIEQRQTWDMGVNVPGKIDQNMRIMLAEQLFQNTTKFLKFCEKIMLAQFIKPYPRPLPKGREKLPISIRNVCHTLYSANHGF